MINIDKILALPIAIPTAIKKASINLALPATNSLRDIIAGDLVAGSAKFIEAFLIAVGIAIGSASILSILINHYGGMAI